MGVFCYLILLTQYISAKCSLGIFDSPLDYRALNMKKIPAKEAEAIPWDRLSVDIIGPYKIRRERHDDPLVIKELTVIEPSIRCFERVR